MESIDLGLSVKWGSCNIGANHPEDYGHYFAWGETTPKDDYYWNTYKYGSDRRELTKYCMDSDYGKDGFADYKTVLDPEDDAARANWGGAWRMPTDAEWTELRENCTWTWTTLNGVNGYEVKSNTNGNSIFLPAAGRLYYGDLNLACHNGWYWSSSRDTDKPGYACYAFFYSDDVCMFYDGRFYGHSVRSVLSND